ncbi:uncharacterized protein [Lolium perenne]|uniref:uncharacterized protein n=1 Tax=Lolium perenne TaxID=4522 RepID=UPI003A99DCB3
MWFTSHRTTNAPPPHAPPPLYLPVQTLARLLFSLPRAAKSAPSLPCKTTERRRAENLTVPSPPSAPSLAAGAVICASSSRICWYKESLWEPSNRAHGRRFPATAAALRREIPATLVLLRPNRAHLHLAGAQRRRCSGDPLDSSPSPYASPRSAATPTPSRPFRFAPERCSSASPAMVVSSQRFRLGLVQKAAHLLPNNIRCFSPADLLEMGLARDPQIQSVATSRPDRALDSAAFASSRIGSRSVDVRYDEFSDKFFCSFSQVRDDDVSKVTLPAWPGQGYGRYWLSSGLLVQFVSCPYSDVFGLLYDMDLCMYLFVS